MRHATILNVIPSETKCPPPPVNSKRHNWDRSDFRKWVQEAFVRGNPMDFPAVLITAKFISSIKAFVKDGGRVGEWRNPCWLSLGDSFYYHFGHIGQG